MALDKKNSILIYLIYGIIFVMYNLSVFTVFGNLNDVFWASYGFLTLTYILQIGCTISIMNSKDVKTVFFGIPLFSFSLYFLLVEFLISTIFIILREHVSFKTALVVQALIFCIFLIVSIIAILARNIVRASDSKIKEKVSFIKSVVATLDILMAKAKDEEVKKRLKSLIEVVRYSDPMSNEAVSIQEKKISLYVEELEMEMDKLTPEDIISKCDEIEMVFTERNKKLKAMK